MSKNIFVIVEGPDASGKTSIAKALAKRIHALYFERPSDLKADTSQQHEPEYYENIGRKLSSKIKEELNESSVVIARYIYTIPALFYSYTGKIRPVITDVIKPNYIVYCYADQDVLNERIKKRSENGEQISVIESDAKKYKRLCERYGQLFKKGENIIKIDTSNKTVDESVNEILNSLKIN